MKICRVCKEKKELTEFYKKKRNADGFDNRCKLCKKGYDRVHNAKSESRELRKGYNAKPENKAIRNKYRHDRYNSDEEYRKKKSKESKEQYKGYKDRRKEVNKIWRDENPDRLAEYDLKRKSRIKVQTPNLTKEETQRIKDLYKESKRLTKSTGIQRHIHHIKRLIDGGLHHPDNLVILTEEEHIEIHKKDR